ncbi:MULTISPECIES: hypothetical protein [Streptococcus]|uniref:hypothetical protein n=1 Tax=Streptococcus TaxID=1301 RepID=UPI0007798DAE|nr:MULTISPECIES: hypothetical protein [Streptococcus]AMP66372.1 hypothetical protein ATM98_01050 [Streptococcus sp. A12]RSK11540.1 hypothetical protein D8784_000483 [Streptococcus australis]
MKIKHILQLPFGTSINLDENVPESGVVGKFLTVDFENYYKVEGVPTNIFSEVLISKAETLTEGQEVHFV